MAKLKVLKYSKEDVMSFLEEHGKPGAKKALMKHGAKNPFFGTSISDMKKLTKKIKKDHELSLSLYETGNTDAMYFAGLIADETRISKDELQKWAKDAYWHLLSESTVAWVAAESNYGFELAREWLDDDQEMIAPAGWATFSSLLSIRDSSEFDPSEISRLLNRINSSIHSERNRVRYTMNNFVICVGAYLPDFTGKAKEIGNRIGKVDVDMGGTACRVPLITPYIEKIEARGAIGKKRKHARC